MTAQNYFTFIEGAISMKDWSRQIQGLATDHTTGAHSTFSGYVRADEIDSRKVIAIEYSAYTDMAASVCTALMKEIGERYKLNHVMVLHSLGRVKAGECCLFVLTTAPHRRDAMQACQEVVERIKKEVPVWGKELFDDKRYSWKINN